MTTENTAVQTVEDKLPALMQKITPEQVKAIVDKCKTSVEKATAVASVWIGKEITNDEDDAKVQDLCVTIRNTFEDRENDRKGITEPMNAFVKELIAINKPLSTDKSVKESLHTQLTQQRADYANVKYQKKLADEAKAKAELREKEIAAELKAYFESLMVSSVSRSVGVLRSWFSDEKNAITLENYEEKVGKVNAQVKLNLPQTAYNKWFAYNQQALHSDHRLRITEAEFLHYTSSMDMTGMTYDDMNKKYLAEAEPMRATWLSEMPALKAKLEELAELEKTNAAAAQAERDRIQAENDERDRLAREAQEQKDKEAQDKIAQEKGEQMLEANFDATVALQQVEESKGTEVRKAILAEGVKLGDLPVIFSKLLIECLRSEKFQLYKLDKNKAVKTDDDGDAVMNDALQVLLDFYAKNSDAPIDGVTVKTKLAVQNRKTL